MSKQNRILSDYKNHRAHVIALLTPGISVLSDADRESALQHLRIFVNAARKHLAVVDGVRLLELLLQYMPKTPTDAMYESGAWTACMIARLFGSNCGNHAALLNFVGQVLASTSADTSRKYAYGTLIFLIDNETMRSAVMQLGSWIPVSFLTSDHECQSSILNHLADRYAFKGSVDLKALATMAQAACVFIELASSNAATLEYAIETIDNVAEIEDKQRKSGMQCRTKTLFNEFICQTLMRKYHRVKSAHLRRLILNALVAISSGIGSAVLVDVDIAEWVNDVIRADPNLLLDQKRQNAVCLLLNNIIVENRLAVTQYIATCPAFVRLVSYAGTAYSPVGLMYAFESLAEKAPACQLQAICIYPGFEFLLARFLKYISKPPFTEAQRLSIVTKLKAVPLVHLMIAAAAAGVAVT